MNAKTKNNGVPAPAAEAGVMAQFDALRAVLSRNARWGSATVVRRADHRSRGWACPRPRR